MASALLIGSCFKIGLDSRAVARRSRDGRDGGTLIGVKSDMNNMKGMFKEAGIDVHKEWLHDEKRAVSESKEALMAELTEFFSQKDKSNFVLYYTGHGAPKGNWVLNSTESDGNDKDELISLKEIINLWDAATKTCNRLVIIADSCHSGAWVDELNKMERKDIAMNASCQAEKTCGDTPEGGRFTMNYIVGCEGFFAGSRKWLQVTTFLVANSFLLGIPFLAKYGHYSRKYRYQPVCTDTESEILPLFDSFTEATLGSHWIA